MIVSAALLTRHTSNDNQIWCHIPSVRLGHLLFISSMYHPRSGDLNQRINTYLWTTALSLMNVYFNHDMNTVFRPETRCANKRRDDLIVFDPLVDTVELEKNMNIVKSLSVEHKSAITELIVKYWDCQRGTRLIIMDYEFVIDNGASKPVCYLKTHIWPT